MLTFNNLTSLYSFLPKEIIKIIYDNYISILQQEHEHRFCKVKEKLLKATLYIRHNYEILSYNYKFDLAYRYGMYPKKYRIIRERKLWYLHEED